MPFCDELPLHSHPGNEDSTVTTYLTAISRLSLISWPEEKTAEWQRSRIDSAGQHVCSCCNIPSALLSSADNFLWSSSNHRLLALFSGRGFRWNKLNPFHSTFCRSIRCDVGDEFYMKEAEYSIFFVPFASWRWNLSVLLLMVIWASN